MYKIIILALITLISACTPTSEDIFSADGAWVREAPPNASAMAGYVTITNNSDKDRTLVFAKSKQFNAVEIHRTIVEDGVAKMRRQEDLPIPAGESLVLEPGSYHLMLMTPKSAYKADDEVTVTVCLRLDGDPNNQIEEVDIVMPVKKPNT